MYKEVANSGGKKTYSFLMYYPHTNGINQKMSADFKFDNNVLTVSNVQYFYYSARVNTAKDWTVATQPLSTAVGTSALDSNIVFNYDSYLGAAQGPYILNNWYYNQADGYFYFMGKIEAGMNSTNLLKSIQLKDAVGNSYAMMEYNLIINMEAIQNTAAAITGASGWGMLDSELRTELLKYCDQ
jgi:hypothetical protein